MPSPPLNKLAFVGSYVPRRCGIATFTHDVRSAIAARLPRAACLVVPVTDGIARHAYPDEAAFEIRADDPGSFERAAAFLNLWNADVVSLQHEYGIFGGEAGSHVLALLRGLRAPVHTTLHTVLARPPAAEHRVMDDVIRLSARLTVMTERGRALLEDVHRVPRERIDVIPHGIPDARPAATAGAKQHLGLGGRQVLLTFGLLSPGKGIEHVIEALPEIAARHPDVVYVVLGATHPQLVAREGERYRESLVRRAGELGVSGHVAFHDRYVDLPDLLAFIAAADIYLTPYLGEDQITSGTLAYAFGCGVPVVSTPYWHARELLAEGRGVLVPFRDPAAIATAVDGLLGDRGRCAAMRTEAWRLGSGMVWSRVAERYVEAFGVARNDAAVRPRRPGDAIGRRPRPELPPVRLDHLLRLSDSTGLLQHATYDVPSAAHGYCTDDNARGLALMVQLDALGLDSEASARLTSRYATFLGHAFVPATGRFRNLLSFDRRWLDDEGTDDCLGRAVLALGTCIGRSRRRGLAAWALGLFRPALDAITACPSPRAWALGILGVQEYLRQLDGDRHADRVRRELMERLLGLYQRNASAEWPWPENTVSYDNARLCQALIAGGRWTGEVAALEAGLVMLDWLTGIQRGQSGRFSPVGSRGFRVRGAMAAEFDQQPLEAHATIAASLEAFHATGDARWADRAWEACEWFLGHNAVGLVVCDPATGGCRDGLLEDRTNDNQGAESTLAWLAALADMRSLAPSPPEHHAPHPHRGPPATQQRPRPLPALRAPASRAGDEDHRSGRAASR